MYSEKVMDHFKNPRNMGDMKNPDGIGKVGNPICGDVMWMFIRVAGKDGEERIKDIRFQTFGCVAAIATSSMMTEIAKGKTLGEALEVGNSDVAVALKGLPPIKMHCSNMAADALHAAIRDYLSKKEKKRKKL
jgi:nitrogen fixation NifU-like protein